MSWDISISNTFFWASDTAGNDLNYALRTNGFGMKVLRLAAAAR